VLVLAEECVIDPTNQWNPLSAVCYSNVPHGCERNREPVVSCDKSIEKIGKGQMGIGDVVYASVDRSTPTLTLDINRPRNKPLDGNPFAMHGARSKPVSLSGG